MSKKQHGTGPILLRNSKNIKDKPCLKGSPTGVVFSSSSLSPKHFSISSHELDLLVQDLSIQITSRREGGTETGILLVVPLPQDAKILIALWSDKRRRKRERDEPPARKCHWNLVPAIKWFNRSKEANSLRSPMATSCVLSFTYVNGQARNRLSMTRLQLTPQSGQRTHTFAQTHLLRAGMSICPLTYGPPMNGKEWGNSKLITPVK